MALEVLFFRYRIFFPGFYDCVIWDRLNDSNFHYSMTLLFIVEFNSHTHTHRYTRDESTNTTVCMIHMFVVCCVSWVHILYVSGSHVDLWIPFSVSVFFPLLFLVRFVFDFSIACCFCLLFFFSSTESTK